MPQTTRNVFFAIFIVFFLACKKETIVKNDDKFVEQTEELSALQASVSAAGQQFIELSWTAVTNTHFKTINYSIYLDGNKIVDGLTATKYSLINLKPGQSFAIKIVAATSDGKKLEQSLNANTLALTTTQSLFYREYSVHSFSTITGSAGMQKLADGGHIFVRLLSHDAYFGGEAMKVIVFRLDKDGTMLWYRLLSASAYSISGMEEMMLTLHNADKEAVVYIRGFAAKLNVVNGEVLLTKDFRPQLGSQTFQSVFNASSQQDLLGTTNGSLLAINTNDLSVNWLQANASRPGSIVAINVDSKKNVYYIFRDNNDRYAQIRIHKCDATGAFLTSFLFDGLLPNENNWGFWMTALVVDAQDNFYLFGHNSDYNYLRYFKFSADGTLLKRNTTSDNFLAKYAFLNDKGEIVVAGRIDGSLFNTYGTVYIFDKDLNIKSKQIYNSLPYHIIRGITGNADGSYNIFLNYMQTYTYENPNFVFFKTGIDGKI